MPPVCPGFLFGSISETNTCESFHYHAQLREGYICLEGEVEIKCRLGSQERSHLLSPFDVLLIPAGVVHLVTWKKPGLAYVVRGAQVASGPDANKRTSGFRQLTPTVPR